MVRWITSHSEYVDFYNPDFQFRTAYFYVPVLYSKGETAVGITIGRKIGNAVKRNLLKRRIKSWLYSNQEKLPIGFRFNLVARIGAADLQWLELSQELLKVITQINTKAVY
ncbi:MAG: ribonuclease P protein component [Candidatus Cloacimonetes bacterium]|jgi:ribonuclease P protein component|nr:ribonuclease P protein component [Candidatus Cloacimonas sp.]MDD2251182.1 ribonuclease P protein component [Candidatus Cloacimonadota bacterium]MDD4677552.1 ribonuclease P protein component [Candidatus Cloacimonadota bacterium]HNV93045.1 ribonuclease P protein component [Candidatus Cloacimonas sp.]HOQ78441.1 ribonuclease P protein component [Candidatus Cloacimonas sp.]